MQCNVSLDYLTEWLSTQKSRSILSEFPSLVYAIFIFIIINNNI